MSAGSRPWEGATAVFTGEAAGAAAGAADGEAPPVEHAAAIARTRTLRSRGKRIRQSSPRREDTSETEEGFRSRFRGRPRGGSGPSFQGGASRGRPSWQV